MTRTFLLGLALFAATLAFSRGQSIAVAADADVAVEQAKQHFGRGVAFYRDGDFDAALAEFNKAYETRPDYRVLYNIGQVQAERHDNAAAMKVLKQYVKEGDGQLDNERRAAVEQTLRDLAKRVGSVAVTANVPDAEVLIDGVSAASLPLGEPLVVNAGIREITVRNAGETATPRRITIAGGDSLQLEFTLGTGARRDLAAPQPGPAPVANRTRVWIAYGAAAVLGVGAGTFALLARRANQNLDADLGRFPGDRAQIDSDRSSLKTRAGLTDGFAAAALIAAGVGTYFLFSGPSASESAPTRSAQLSLLSSGAALSLSGSF